MVIGIGNPKLGRQDSAVLCRDLNAAVRADVLRQDDARRIENILQRAFLREAGEVPGRALDCFRDNAGEGAKNG